MGSYLSEPVVDKISSDDSNDKLVYGASSMQGWRVSQEDAHNCVLNFDTNVSLFAVYDGHGGHEVAQYCSQKLPEFIKNTDAYKEGNIEKALIDGFLGFDKTIASREVVAVLKEIAGDKEAEEDSDEDENVDDLREEASMPIEQVIEKYTNLVNPSIKTLKKAAAEGEKLPKSPFLKAKPEDSNSKRAEIESSVDSSVEETAGASGTKETTKSCVEGCSSSSAANSNNPDGVSSSSNEVNGVSTPKNASKDTEETKLGQNGPVPDIVVTSSDSTETKESLVTPSDSKEEEGTPCQNGEVTSEDKADVTSSSAAAVSDNGLQTATAKGKGKALAKTKGAKSPRPKKVLPKRNAHQLYKCLLNFENEEESEESEDEEDKTFVGPHEDSEDEDDGVNVAIECEGSEEEGEEEESSEAADEEDGEEEEEDEMDDDDDDLEFARNMKEEPGSDSGCTAVVAVLKGNELYVANAGDSRCIVCRNGKAVEMSFDHKPEDDPERERIVKAGGKVTPDGRVNGGLNLSRAIGDHAYKQNTELSDKEQMITALPDIKTLTINPAEDEFMVLACDGIWNFMSSQEVVDFVRPRIQEKPDKISQICEELFDHCLAPDTMGDGTGCDNMTAIIVQFKSNLRKRAASEEYDTEKVETSDAKRAKTETETAVSSLTSEETDVAA